MEEEQIVKGFDIQIVRRIGAFVKPYWPLVLLAMIGLIGATIGELMTPVALQRAVDNHLVVSWTSVSAPIWDEIRRDNPDLPAGVVIGEELFLSETERNADLPSSAKALVRESGNPGWILSSEAHLASDVGAVLGKPGDAWIADDSHLAIRKEALHTLDRELIRKIRARDRIGLRHWSLVYLGLLLLSFGAGFLQVYLMAYVSQRVMRDLREALAGRTLRQSLAFHGERPLGSLVSRITSDVETINEFLTEVALTVFKDLGLMVGVVVTLFALNPRLALYALASLPPVLILLLIFRKKARDTYRRVRLWTSRVNAFLSEHLQGIDVVQLFARERETEKGFDRVNGKLFQAFMGEMYVFALFRPGIDFLAQVSIAVILYFGTSLHESGIVTLGVLVAFINLIQKFYRPVVDLSERFAIMQSAMAGGERVFDLLDTEETIPSPVSESEEADRRSRSVIFDGVSFSYKAGEPVIRDLSLSVKPGEKVALVGYTGAGKTTVASLLTRLWDIDEGAILLDGVDIRDISLSELRRRVIPVDQQMFLFSSSVAENISLGLPMDRSWIVEAAKAVRAHDFIEALPEGYDTVLDEGGRNLSTGQKQLLSFARVIAHNPEVLILDEATGSVDTETEQKIQEALKVLFAGRTSLVVAHRISTIRDADRIVVLSRGRIAEQGTHDELIAAEGLYANLYRLQYAGSDS